MGRRGEHNEPQEWTALDELVSRAEKAAVEETDRPEGAYVMLEDDSEPSGRGSVFGKQRSGRSRNGNDSESGARMRRTGRNAADRDTDRAADNEDNDPQQTDSDEELAAESENDAAENDPVSASDSPRVKGPSWFERNLAQVLSGSILTRVEVRRMYPYVLFIVVLMFLYIANGYHIQKLHRRHDRLTEQVKELRSRSLTISSIRMTQTRQSEIIKQLEERGIPLEESLIPPKIIDK
jgi:hypothetical protein